MTTLYKVNDIYPCIQGEGTLTGVPMVMVRLQGCPVGCPFCDTKETWATDPADQTIEMVDALGVNPRWAAATALGIADKVMSVARHVKWALISGGEPLLQNCGDLTTALRSAGFQTALETSGTAHVSGEWSWLTVSPKVGMPGGRGIIDATIKQANEIKWVVGKPADLDALDAFLARYQPAHTVNIALQPLSLNEKATLLCVDRCLERGWRLSVQTHKFVFSDWKTRSV